jgi:hypothetical protein
MQFTRKSLIPGLTLEGPTTYVFRLNPDKLSVTRKKMEKWSFTKAGFERTDWDQAVIEFNYSGMFGVFRPDEPAPGFVPPTSVETFDIRTTQAWIKFAEFEQYFRKLAPEEEIEMTWWQQPYNHKGSIGEFTYDLDVERPKVIPYRFKFTAIPDQDRPEVIITSSPTTG